MSRRITQKTVLNFLGGLIITGLVGTGLFNLLIAQGLLTVQGHNSNIYCGADHPCWIELNVTATDDIFIYPMDGTMIVNAKPTDTINEYHLYRSWGSGWREINLSKPCAGTWCGGKSNTENKFVFAFREDRQYQLRIEIFKAWNSTINWSINPSGTFVSVFDDGFEYITETINVYDTKKILNKENNSYYEETYINRTYNITTKKIIPNSLTINDKLYENTLLQLNDDGEYQAYQYFDLDPKQYCPNCRCRPYEEGKICKKVEI